MTTRFPEYPELHHYTGTAGLQGIAKSNSLWATHYLDLNDATEVMHARQPLLDGLTSKVFDLLKRSKQSSPRIERAIRASGGLTNCANTLAKELLDAVYQVAFSDSSQIRMTPYILSFCSHADQKYEGANGLLSQWRGYGQGGRFCLVFDTDKLFSMMEQEARRYAYTYCALEPVNYATDDKRPEDLFSDFFDACEEFVFNAIKGKSDKASMEGSFIPFVRGSTFYKHQGFREECEVRIVAIPDSESTLQKIQETHPGIKLQELKQPFVSRKMDIARRYINLFEEMDAPLPIKRIVIGPSRDQNKGMDEAAAVFKDVPIHKSATPFVD